MRKYILTFLFFASIFEIFEVFHDLGDVRKKRCGGKEDTARGGFRGEGDTAVLRDGESDTVLAVHNEGDDVPLVAKEKDDLLLCGAKAGGVRLFIRENEYGRV